MVTSTQESENPKLQSYLYDLQSSPQKESSPGQSSDLSPLLHTEPAGSVAAAERSEALVGNAGGPGHKLKRQRRRKNKKRRRGRPKDE